MAAKITWESCAWLENLQLSSTDTPNIPTPIATYTQLPAQLPQGELVCL